MHAGMHKHFELNFWRAWMIIFKFDHKWLRTFAFIEPLSSNTCLAYIEGTLPKGPYLPCLHMADRALWAGYPRYVNAKLVGNSMFYILTWSVINSLQHKDMICNQTSHLNIDSGMDFHLFSIKPLPESLLTFIHLDKRTNLQASKC